MSGDGVALQATTHPSEPIEITEEMIAAGLGAFPERLGTESPREIVTAIYKAMAEAQPFHDIRADTVTETEVELTLDERFVERMAIRLARSQGSAWDGHTDQHKEGWRAFVREVWPEFKNAPFTLTMKIIEAKGD